MERGGASAARTSPATGTKRRAAEEPAQTDKASAPPIARAQHVVPTARYNRAMLESAAAGVHHGTCAVMLHAGPARVLMG